MNTSNIKRYAPIARKDFIAAITKQAEKYGISAKAIAPIEIKGDLALIAGKPFPAAIASPRSALVKIVEQQGFNQTIEQVAYSWFNRLCAIRYMELHDYLGHGRRVLSHPEHPTGYQLLDDCLDVDLPGLNANRVQELKLDGTQDETLYRELLLAQCHALHTAMPFLFEPIDDASELLLPENLTKTDSLIHDLVTEIPEEDWQSVEIIGWLYQFYISEKKDEVIGKVVKSEDIPAATQLFTPNWIVKYMVQNSLGAQWLATYPDSPLKAQMEYYIEPAEQTDEVSAQLKAITPNQLNPEELTLIDPASGSGHILVEAYELFKAIYLERGYRQRDIPQLILEKNLFGLDIDERAAQLTGFALMMKGRADDRRLFERGVKLNVMALVDSAGFDADAVINGVKLDDYGLMAGDLTELKRLFEHAMTFGSLIQVPEGLASSLPALKQLSEVTSQDLFVSEELSRLGPLVQQAELLAAQYDAVVMNPPYMGSSAMNGLVKKFTKDSFPDARSDLFACFIERGYALAKERGNSAMVTMQSWMFLSSFQKMRERMLREKTIRTLAQIGYNSFPSMNSKVAQAAVFCVRNECVVGFRGAFTNLNNAPQSADKQGVFLARDPANRFDVSVGDFRQIPGSPVAYWVSSAFREIFNGPDLKSSVGKITKGIFTGANERFLRMWHEVADPLQGWQRYDKAGGARRWFGLAGHVLDWRQSGDELSQFPGAGLGPMKFFDKPHIVWSGLTSGDPSFRDAVTGVWFDDVSPAVVDEALDKDLLCFLNSKVVRSALNLINPTLHYQAGDIGKLPSPPKSTETQSLRTKCVGFSRRDWDSYETSWDFQSLPLLTASSDPTPTLESSYTAWITQNKETIAEMKRLEEENNRLFIDAYGLADELTPDVAIEQITLTVNPAYRYGGKLTVEEQWSRFRQDTMEELVSYAIGCIMGRYSLDTPGLVYANSGNIGFDASQYTTFPADDDGIVPLTEQDWFNDDACNRLVEFIGVSWKDSDLEINLRFLADNLKPKKGESSRETLRRYLVNQFFKDHLQSYKKRPIYWLFSSGKQKAFQCLVYLHRYNEGTLARMRTEYVIPLTAKMSSHVQKLEKDVETSDSAAEVKRLEKEIAKLHKQQAELSDFDEKLRHYADMRISLDLDEGVKVNYGRFGDLLSDVKAIHGKAPEVIV